MTNGVGGNGQTGNTGATKPVDLPDPSGTALKAAAAFLIGTVVVAAVFTVSGWDQDPFDPTGPGAPPGGNFGLFAGFFIGTTVLERVMELIAPHVPFWSITVPDTPSATPGGPAVPPTREQKIAAKKADRGYVLLTLATFVGALLSAGLGLYFLELVGMQVDRGTDIVFSGLVIAGGTKGMHELIKALEKVKGTGTPAG